MLSSEKTSSQFVSFWRFACFSCFFLSHCKKKGKNPNFYKFVVFLSNINCANKTPPPFVFFSPLEIRFCDVSGIPEYEETALGGPGEVCVRGNSVFKGYYKMPEKTYDF